MRPNPTARGHTHLDHHPRSLKKQVFSDCFFGFDLANNNNGNGQMTSPGGEEDGEYDDDNGQYAHAGDAMVAAAKEPMASSPPRNTRHNTRSKQRESVEPSMADLR